MLTRALVLAGGSGPRRAELDAAWPGWDGGIDLVVGADGGALLAEPLGLTLDLVVGDFDSLGEAALDGLARSGVAIERSPVDKDSSDTELALLAVAARGAGSIVVLGAFGGRVDHALANVWILCHPALAGRSIALLDGQTRVRLLDAADPPGGLLPAGLDLADRAGDLVSLLPFDGPATGVTTHGLRWALSGARLPAGISRGLSNEVLGRPAEAPRVELGGGRLLVIETTC